MATAKKATIENARIKMMVWGGPGSGKSRFALTSPKPLVIDLERSTDMYHGQFNFYKAIIDQSNDHAKNSVVLTQTIINEVLAGEYNGTVETLIIDPVTDLLDTLESMAMNTYEAKTKRSISELNRLEITKWYSFRRDKIREFLDKIINLPLNIIFIAREKILWGSENGKTQPVGKIFDGLDIIEYLPDIVINLDKNGNANIKKSRMGNLPEVLEVKNWSSITNFFQDKKKDVNLEVVKKISKIGG